MFTFIFSTEIVKELSKQEISLIEMPFIRHLSKYDQDHINASAMAAETSDERSNLS